MSVPTATEQPKSAKRLLPGEPERSNKRQKVNGREFTAKASTEADLKPQLADLSASASLKAKVVEPLNVSTLTASDLSQIRDQEALIVLFDQTMDYTSPIDLSPDGAIEELTDLGLTNSPLFQFMLGYSYLEKKECPTANSHFRDVLPKDRRYVCAQLGRATCFFFEGDTDQAIEYANRVPKDNASYDSAQYKIGCFYGMKKEYLKAIDQFLIVKKPQPRLEILLATAKKAGSDEKPLFDPEVQLPLYDAAQFNLGCCFYNLGESNFVSAAHHFELVAERLGGKNNPRFDTAQYYLGLIHLAQKESAKAEVCFKKVKVGSLFHAAAQAKLQK